MKRKMKRLLNDHINLIKKGLKLYDDFKYHESLPYLKKAYNLAPNCICAMYNYANVLHMLGKDEKAHDVILNIIDTPPEKAKRECEHISHARGFIVDAHFLMFYVIIYGQGYNKEAFDYAENHLKLRTRGVKSVWTKRQVQSEINHHKKKWKKIGNEECRGKVGTRDRQTIPSNDYP